LHLAPISRAVLSSAQQLPVFVRHLGQSTFWSTMRLLPATCRFSICPTSNGMRS
jgi:hypothetical protein